MCILKEWVVEVKASGLMYNWITTVVPCASLLVVPFLFEQQENNI